MSAASATPQQRSIQNSPVAISYITAFLGLHTKSLSGYRPIFRDKKLPGTLPHPAHLSIQHHEPSAKKVIDFTEPYLSLGYNGYDIKNAKIADAWKLSRYGTSWKRALIFEVSSKFHWPTRENEIILFGFPVIKSTAGYQRLAIRLCQLYDPEQNVTSGYTRNVGVRIGLTRAKSSLIVPYAYTSFVGADYRKNVYSTYVIPLADFSQSPLYISSLTLLFPGKETGRTLFMVGDVELWK